MQLAVTEWRYVEVKQSTKRRIEKADREQLCLACLQPLASSEAIRGVHPKCYRATMRAIASGRTTDSERVLNGKLAERSKPGRKPSNPVSQELNN